MRLLSVPLAVFACLAAASLVILATKAGAVTFNDGMVHVVDALNSFPFDESSDVLDGPFSTPTTLNIVEGGDIGSQVAGRLTARGSSLVNMSGGIIGEALFGRHEAQVNVTGGTLGGLNIGQRATAQVSGGTLSDLTASADAVVNMSGGECSIILVSNDAVVNVSGGTLRDGLKAIQFSALNISGGSIGRSLVALNESTITIFGFNFNFSLGELSPFSGTLTGSLADGTAFTTNFTRSSTATINLILTEPPPDSDGESPDR